MSDNSKNRNKNDQNGNCDNWFILFIHSIFPFSKYCVTGNEADSNTIAIDTSAHRKVFHIVIFEYDVPVLSTVSVT